MVPKLRVQQEQIWDGHSVLPPPGTETLTGAARGEARTNRECSGSSTATTPKVPKNSPKTSAALQECGT